MYIILIYDIAIDDGGKRILPKVYKLCKKYVTHIQNSVFEGEIQESKLIKLKYELNRLIRKDKDSVIIFKSRNIKWLEKDFLTDEEDKTNNFI